MRIDDEDEDRVLLLLVLHWSDVLDVSVVVVDAPCVARQHPTSSALSYSSSSTLDSPQNCDMGRRLPNSEGRGVGDNGLLLLLLPPPPVVHMDDMLL